MNIEDRVRGYKDTIIASQKYLDNNGEWMYCDFLCSCKEISEQEEFTNRVNYIDGVYDYVNSELMRLKRMGYYEKDLMHGETIKSRYGI